MKDFVCKNKSYSSGIKDCLPHILKSNNLKINKLLELQVKMSWKPQTLKQTLKRLMSPFLNSLDQGFHIKIEKKFKREVDKVA